MNKLCEEVGIMAGKYGFREIYNITATWNTRIFFRCQSLVATQPRWNEFWKLHCHDTNLISR